MAESKDSVRAVERAIDILEVFTFEKPKLTLSQVCSAVDLPKTTVYRSLTTLEKRGILFMNQDSGTYQLGYEMIKLGAIAQSSNTLNTVAHDEMLRLSSVTEQTCNLYIRDGMERFCVAQIAGSQYVLRYSRIGARLPLYCGAGKLLLAYADEEFRDNYLKNVSFNHFTDRTICDGETLRRDIEQILRDGYSVSKGERDPASAMVAAPVFDYTGKCVAALTISGPVYFFTPENVEGYVRQLCLSTKRVSQKLGYVE